MSALARPSQSITARSRRSRRSESDATTATGTGDDQIAHLAPLTAPSGRQATRPDRSGSHTVPQDSDADERRSVPEAPKPAHPARGAASFGGSGRGEVPFDALESADGSALRAVDDATVGGRVGPVTVDEVLDLVRAEGGRATSPKRLVLEVLFANRGHLTAEEIGAAVQARNPDVHLTTIYRNLDEFQRLGVVVHSHLGHGPATFQLAVHAHAHLVCELCGRRFEAPDDLFEELAHRARAELGFTIDPRHFAILGRCSSCAACQD